LGFAGDTCGEVVLPVFELSVDPLEMVFPVHVITFFLPAELPFGLVVLGVLFSGPVDCGVGCAVRTAGRFRGRAS
jgi:hypothetical protein